MNQHFKRFIAMAFAFILLFAFSFSTVQAATKTQTVSSKVHGVIVHKSFLHTNSLNSRGNWSQENYYYYLKKKEATKYANELKSKAKKYKASKKIIKKFTGKTPYGKIISFTLAIKAGEANEIANAILKQTKKGKGNVKFTSVKNAPPYSGGISVYTIKYWDGKKIDVTSYKNTKTINGVKSTSEEKVKSIVKW